MVIIGSDDIRAMAQHNIVLRNTFTDEELGHGVAVGEFVCTDYFLQYKIILNINFNGVLPLITLSSYKNNTTLISTLVYNIPIQQFLSSYNISLIIS